SDVAVKIFGDDRAVLNRTAEEISQVLERVSGASEVKVEQTTGLPVLSVAIDRNEAARYGLDMSDVQAAVAVAVGGVKGGTLYQGDRRFDIVVRLADALRGDFDAIRRLPLALPNTAGGLVNYIPLGAVATLGLALGPNQISREDGKRRIVVTANVRGRDIGSF